MAERCKGHGHKSICPASFLYFTVDGNVLGEKTLKLLVWTKHKKTVSVDQVQDLPVDTQANLDAVQLFSGSEGKTPCRTKRSSKKKKKLPETEPLKYCKHGSFRGEERVWGKLEP